jgi:hypothetical protein
MIHDKYGWYINNTRTKLGDFHGLTDENIYDLKHVGTINGIEIFENSKMPKGTVELRRNDTFELLAVIRGLDTK